MGTLVVLPLQLLRVSVEAVYAKLLVVEHATKTVVVMFMHRMRVCVRPSGAQVPPNQLLDGTFRCLRALSHHRRGTMTSDAPDNGFRLSFSCTLVR